MSSSRRTTISLKDSGSHFEIGHHLLDIEPRRPQVRRSAAHAWIFRHSCHERERWPGIVEGNVEIVERLLPARPLLDMPVEEPCYCSGTQPGTSAAARPPTIVRVASGRKRERRLN